MRGSVYPTDYGRTTYTFGGRRLRGLEHFAIDPACIDHYARIVSEWSKDNTVSFGLREMIKRFRDCLGR